MKVPMYRCGRSKTSPILQSMLVLILLTSSTGSCQIQAAYPSRAIWFVNDLGRPLNASLNDTWGLSDICIGDADNDGCMEAYASCWYNGHVFQISSANGIVTSDDLGPLSVGDLGGMSIKVGDADDDGFNEVYTGVFLRNGTIWPLTYVFQLRKGDDSWIKTSMGAAGNSSVEISIGDGNNDERKELFSTDLDGHIYMFYKTQAWNSHDIGNSTQNITAAYLSKAFVGDGRNTGTNFLYASRHDGTVYEINYTVGLWTWNVIGDAKDSEESKIAIGDADNDGYDEIYEFSIGHGTQLFMLKWNSSECRWVSSKLAEGISDPVGWHNQLFSSLCIGDGNSDGKNEIYITNSHNLFQVWNVGSSWDWTIAASINTSINAIALGSITGDQKQMEIYAAGRDGHVYQFYTDGSPPANPIIRSDTHPIPATWYNRSTVHVLWNDTGQDISGIKGYSVLWDNVPNTLPKEKIDFGPTVQEAFSPKLADRKDWYFHIRSCDGAGNWNRTTATFGPIFIDTTPPADLKVAIDDGAGCTNDEDAVLSAEASDDQPGSGPAWMSFSNDGQSWGDWEQFCATRPGWSLADSSFGGTDVDGPKEVWLKVKDLAGNEVAAIHRAKAEIFLDRVAPGGLGLTIEDGAEWTNRAEVTVAFHASDPEPASGLWRYTLSNDGISWSEWMDWTDKAAWSLTEGAGGIDSDGAKSVYLRVSDRAGNIGGPVSATIFLDRRPPGQLGLIINGGAGFTNASEVSLAVHVADPEPGSAGLEMAFSNDGSEFSPWEPAYDTRDNWSLIAGAGGQDSDGSKTVQLRTRDAAGNLGGPVNGSIFLDRVNPDGLSITINGGAKYTNGLDVNLSLSAKDAEPSSGLWTMQFSTDGVSWTEWEPFSSCRTYHLDGPEGPRTVHFRVKDRAGNVGGEATATVILDATPPLITGVTAAGISSRSAVIMWQSDEDADSAVEYGPTGAYGMSAVNGTFMTSHSLLLKGLTPSTTYHFRVASRDKAGNGPAMSADMAFTTTAKDDFVPPMISDVRVLGLSDRQAVVGWNTNEPADSSADWGRTGFYDRTARDDRFTLVHSLTLEGLSPSTSYHFRVGSSDSSGNGPSFSPDFTFTTLAKPDITPPVISDVTILAFSDRQAVLSWKTDEAADTVVEYGRDMGYGKKAEDRTLVTAHQLVLSGLSPSTTYHFRIKATDAVGNGPSISPDFAFMTKATPDTTPPVISGIKVLNVTGTSALVAWDTDEASTGFVEYGTGKGYGISVEGGKFTAHHVLLLQNLTPGRTYHFRVYSTDVSGNRAGPSADSSFFTPKPPPGPDGADTGQAAPIVLVLLLLAGIAVFLFTRARRPSP